MQGTTPDLFEDVDRAAPRHWLEAFEAWRLTREADGTMREASSVAVYRSMWGALTAWCVARGLGLHALSQAELDSYLRSRGGSDELTPRHAWRLLMLFDAVASHRARQEERPPNTAAQALLQATPAWRYANAADRTPLPEHLHAAEARRLVAWLLDPGTGTADTGASTGDWQSLRNRTAVALQLGAGLTPGDLRAATLDGVTADGARSAGLPWKIRLPAHGSTPAREAPIAPWAGRLLRRWIETRQALAIAGPCLFPATRAGRPWGKVAQYNAARSVLAAAGVSDPEGGSFRLRHTFALRQLRRGSAPELVAQWLGLADTAALARYRRVLLAPADVV